MSDAFPVSPPQRQGLNCTLSYSSGKAVTAYRVRCSGLTWGFSMIADESQARDTRAYYPHQTAPDRFALTIDLIGQREKNSFNGWIMSYAGFILDPGFTGKSTPQMTVSVPSRNFKRTGVPLEGAEFGIHVGAMVYSPTIIFETAGEPLDWNDHYYISGVRSGLAYYKSPDSRYFYPTGTQLRGGDAPAPAGGPTATVDPVQSAVNGPTSPANAQIADAQIAADD